MPPLVTDAIVLHAFDYLETSRVLRLLTREAGVQSVLAKGARRSKVRFGSSMDLFAEGVAELRLKPSRDLQTLAAFDVTRSRSSIAADLGRFTGASALCELVLRFARDDANPALYEALAAALDALSDSTRAPSATLAGAWTLVAALGFAPTVDACAECHRAVPVDADAPFGRRAGGVLCAPCARKSVGERILPASARAALRDWLAGDSHAPATDSEVKAHQRLLREFLQEHLSDERPLRAFDVWERAQWSAA